MRIRVWECGRDFHLIRIDIRKRIPMRIRSEFRVDMPNALFFTSAMARLAAVTKTGEPIAVPKVSWYSTLPHRPGTSHLGRNTGGWPPGRLTVPFALPVRCLHSGVHEPPLLRDQLGHW